MGPQDRAGGSNSNVSLLLTGNPIHIMMTARKTTNTAFMPVVLIQDKMVLYIYIYFTYRNLYKVT